MIALTKNSTDFLEKVNSEEIKVWGHGQKLASGHSNGVDKIELALNISG